MENLWTTKGLIEKLTPKTAILLSYISLKCYEDFEGLCRTSFEEVANDVMSLELEDVENGVGTLQELGYVGIDKSGYLEITDKDYWDYYVLNFFRGHKHGS